MGALSCVGALFLPTVVSYYCECCADTWGSEVGIVSSTPYLLLMPWKPVPAGTNGGISVLGLFAAILAGLSMSLLYYFIQLPSFTVCSLQPFNVDVFRRDSCDLPVFQHPRNVP